MNAEQQATVKDILIQYLKAHNADGLCRDDCLSDPCGCLLADIGWCDSLALDCQVGFKGPSTNPDVDYMLYPTREAAAKADKGIDDEDED